MSEGNWLREIASWCSTIFILYHVGWQDALVFVFIGILVALALEVRKCSVRLKGGAK